MFNIVDDLVARMCLAAVISFREDGEPAEFAGYRLDNVKVHKAGSQAYYYFNNRQDMNMFVQCRPNLLTCCDWVTVEVPTSISLLNRGFSVSNEVITVNIYEREDILVAESSPGYMCVSKGKLDQLLDVAGLSTISYLGYVYNNVIGVLQPAVSTYQTHLLLDTEANHMRDRRVFCSGMKDITTIDLYELLRSVDRDLPAKLLEVRENLR